MGALENSKDTGSEVTRERLELATVNGVGKQVREFMKMFIGGEGPCSFEEAVFGGIRRKYLAQRPDITSVEALYFECIASDAYPVFILCGFQHFCPEFVDVQVICKIMAIRVHIGSSGLGRAALGIDLTGRPRIIGSRRINRRRQGTENNVLLAQPGTVGIRIWPM